MADRVIVTGANGFIGRHCVNSLINEGYDVIACCRKIPKERNRLVKYIACDLNNAESIENMVHQAKATHLLHLAWYVAPEDYMHSYNNFIWLNNSIKLIESFSRYGGRRIVTAGSCAEYEWSIIKGNMVIDEQFSVSNNASLYSATKASLGLLTEAYAKEIGLTAAHARVFYLFGPGENEKRLVPRAIMNLKQGQTINLKSGHYVRDYMYVKDVASAFTKIVSSDLSGPVNVASGMGTSLENLIQTIELTLGCDGMHSVQNITNPNEPVRIVADVRKLKSTGWDIEYSLKSAIEEYSRMYKENI